MDGIKALAFDTGGTILDWHGGLVAGLTEYGEHHGSLECSNGFVNAYGCYHGGELSGSATGSYVSEPEQQPLDVIQNSKLYC